MLKHRGPRTGSVLLLSYDGVLAGFANQTKHTDLHRLRDAGVVESPKGRADDGVPTRLESGLVEGPGVKSTKIVDTQ